jgi:tetratricopeptide (TPR) repeat protein
MSIGKRTGRIMAEGMTRALELKEEARRDRREGEYRAAEAHLREAIEQLKPALEALYTGGEGEADAEELALAKEITDLYGTLGGTLRERGEYVEAAVAYDAGYRFEGDPRYRLASTYCAVNRIVTRIFLEPTALSDATVLRRHDGLPFVEVTGELEQLRELLKRQTAGPRARDCWAVGDLALVSALTGHADTADSSLKRFNQLDPGAGARGAYERIASQLAALDTPRREPLTQLASRLAG